MAARLLTVSISSTTDITTMMLIAPSRQNRGSSICMSPPLHSRRTEDLLHVSRVDADQCAPISVRDARLQVTVTLGAPDGGVLALAQSKIWPGCLPELAQSNPGFR